MHGKIINIPRIHTHFTSLPTVENPSCLQTTLALVLLQESSQIVPQLLL